MEDPRAALLRREGTQGKEAHPTGAVFAKHKRYLQDAGKSIEDMHQRDELYPELWDLIGLTSTISASYVPETDPANPTFRLLKMAPLPETLHQIYKSIECKCFLGLFPEINRAWITVDNQLCLWNYDSKEYAIWNDQDQIIVSVGLVLPKPNVFSDDVKYVLVLATPVEIVLLAVWFEGNTTQGELHLEPTHITLPAENVNMVKIVGTKTGRIFMGGDDGYLYEIDYQAEEGWFSKRARKISHANTLEYLFARWNKQSPLIDLAVDESRNVLYTLSARGTVEVYDLGGDGRGCKRIASADIIAAAEPLCPRLKATQPGKEVTAKSIAVIPASESKYLTLVVTTSNALRLYVATFDVMNDQPPADQRPYKLELMHIRFPPDPYHDFGKTDDGSTATPVRAPVPNTPFSPATVVRRPSPAIPYAVETSYHSQGVDLLGHSIGDRDEVLALHHTLEKDVSQAGEIRPVFQEKATKSAVTGKIWAISEKPLSLFLEERARLAGVTTAMVPTSYERGPELALWCDEANRYPPRHELALQHVLPPRHFFLLTNNGLHTMIKNRPIDRLYRCLAQSMGHDTASLERFEQSYGSAETCAMYLILATAPKLRNFWGGSIDSTIARYAAVQFFSHPEQPQFETLAATYDTPGKLIRYEPAIRFSGKHLGFALYLARLLKPLWNRPVMSLDRIKQVELGDLKMMLLALQQFLDEHPDFAPIPDKLKGATGRRRGRARLPRDDSMEEEEAEPAYPKRNRSIQSVMASYVPGESEQSGAQKEERKALSKLHILLRRSIEMIEFLQIVLENRFIGVTSRLSQADQALLLKARFGEMVTTQEGFELTRALIDALMSAYKEGKGDQASVEAISQKLRTSCPGIFREEDRILHKANELLFKAKLARNPRERGELLAQALELFGVVAADLAEDKMPQVCENFLYLRAYSAVLELALKCAQAIDSDNVALGWYTAHFPPLGEEMIIPPEDDANGGAGAYASRMVCYSYVLSAVAELFLGQAPAFQFIPYEDLERRPVDDADIIATKRTELFRTALLSQDELFHHILYRWFVRSHPIDLSGLLLEMCIHLDSPYIEDFLKTTQSDLLPNYYIRKDQFEKAARACYEMAFSREGLDLEQRIDYLSKAKTAAQSAPGRGDLLSLVTDALDIAQVQSKALQELEALPAARALTPEEKEKRLRGREELLHEGLLDVTTLFNSYVRPFGLWEAGLHVLKVSGHVDEALTKRFWKSIINEELYKMQATGLNLESLRAKILSLGQALERDENVFPVEWICGYLEEMMAKDLRQYAANDYGWVPRVMNEAGFNLPVLFEIYHNALIEENNPDWAEFASQVGRHVAKLEVLKVQRWIISEWMQNLNSARDAHRRLLIAAATSSGLEERIGDYIRATANPRSEEARKLSQAFVDLQALVRRLTYRV